MRAVLTHPGCDPVGIIFSQGKAQRLVCVLQGNDFLLLLGNVPFVVTENISLEVFALTESQRVKNICLYLLALAYRYR